MSKIEEATKGLTYEEKLLVLQLIQKLLASHKK